MTNNPSIKTTIKHSETKPAWNIVGSKLSGKYKICRVPYLITDDDKANAYSKNEAYLHAEFISTCFNNSDSISNLI